MVKPKSPYRSDAHRALAERETAIVDAHAAQGLEAQFAAVAEDRAARWAAILKDREESAAIRKWGADMAVVHRNPQVRIHRNTLDWITALYVARYGEAEDFWPPQLGPADVLKAGRWLRGQKKPEGVVYLPQEG